MMSAASGRRFPWFPGPEGSDLDGAAIGVLLATGEAQATPARCSDAISWASSPAPTTPAYAPIDTVAIVANLGSCIFGGRLCQLGGIGLRTGAWMQPNA